MKRLILTAILLFTVLTVFAQDNSDYICRLGLSYEISKSNNWGIDKPIVTAVYPYSPAQEAGIKVNDIISAIDDVKTAELTEEQIDQLLNPAKKDHVFLTINNLNNISRKIKVNRECKRRNVITEEQLATAFSMYSLENNNDVDTTVIDYSSSLRDSIINIAMTKLGAPYHFGSPGPNSFDCSGFARYVFKQAGISLLRSSREQYKQGEKVEGLDDMSAGDLVFFARRGNIYHVGIVVSVDGNHFKFIHQAKPSI